MASDRNSVIHGNQIKDRTVTKAEIDATSETEGYVLTVQANGSVDWEASTGGGTTFRQTFVNADLTSDKITITHNLNTQHPVVAVYDDSDNIMLPTEVTYKTVNTIELDFTDMTPITGTYKVRVIGSGGIIGHTIQDADNDTKVETEKNTDEDKIRFTTAGTQRAILDENGLVLESGADVNEFSIDGTLAGDSDDAVPTEKAVKTYSDALKPSDLNISNQTAEDFLVFDGTNWIASGGSDLVDNGVFTRDISIIGTQVITGIGFKPKSIHIFANVNTVTGRASMGFGDASGSRCLADISAVTVNQWSNEGGSLVHIQTATGVYAYAQITSLDADGFTLNWAKIGSPIGSAQCKYIAYR